MPTLGYLALVLHAHLPYVRDPDDEEVLEENWLFEAITESYVPIVLLLERLLEDHIEFRLTISLTPTLASMLLDPLLQARYIKKLDKTIELAEKEIARTAPLPDFQPLARLYHQRLVQVREAFVERYDKDLVRALRHFQTLGKVEILASAATHGYLPLLSTNESAARAQIGVGVKHYRQVFGRKPEGFWLPECGYYPGIDRLLAEHGIRYTILETHGVTRADRRPRYGVFAPILCPSGVAAFGRDPDSSRQVWCSKVGYPGDFDYREFYRDLGHDGDLDYVRPYIHPSGLRVDTGLKYYRITGPGDHKEPYVPEWAEHKVSLHAEHFLAERIRQVQEMSPAMDRPPLVVAPYDAELFGHWWFEGPRWIDYLIRKAALDQDTIRLVTLSEYLNQWPDNQVATPCLSSWGRNGFNEVWLNPETDWIYRHLHSGAAVLEKLITRHRRSTGLTRRALNQAGRELLLAQASDWAFMINSGTMKEYAIRRARGHLVCLNRLHQQIDAETIDQSWLENLESRDDPFPGIATAAEFRPRAAVSVKVQEPKARIPVARPAQLKIAMACPEIVPFAKTGGLADMASSLATALERLGHQLCLIMPAYRAVLDQTAGLRETGIGFAVSLGTGRHEAGVLAATLGRNISAYFIRADRYFDRPFLYGTPEGDYPDNAERFTFFARAALEVLRHTGTPHVLHAHDWQAALAVAFLKAQPERYPGLSTVRTVLTIHNLGYQGVFGPDEWDLLNLDASLFTPRHFEFYGKINFLKAGLALADAITTVSPTYAREIQTQDHGFGLEGVLQERTSRLVGILNGVDYDRWNPETDPAIAGNYGPADFSGKRACKADLQKEFGLPEEPQTPLLGMVSRMAAQKGFDLLASAVDPLIAKGLQLVVVGTGDQHYQDLFQAVARRCAGRLGIRIAFDERLARQVEAGADLFLMPSRYEPCGLNQLYSLKYGTIPVVRATGGLKDSVHEFDPATGAGTGFVFEAYESAALLAAVDRALTTFHNKDQWATLMRNAMTADYSWNQSAREYLRLYQSLVTPKRRASPHPKTKPARTEAKPVRTRKA
jgi:1,4-alpha-glucan branching enzyme